MSRPDANLKLSLETFEQRNGIYGDAWVASGGIGLALFPTGVTLQTEMDFQRFGILQQIISKLARYAANFEEGGHQDSAHDMIVYAAILEHLTK